MYVVESDIGIRLPPGAVPAEDPGDGADVVDDAEAPRPAAPVASAVHSSRRGLPGSGQR